MNTLADQYYIKALDQYPYSLEEAMENLGYALSYNTEHVGANYLMGRMYKEHMNNFIKAEEHFIKALASSPEDLNTCMDYILLLITFKEYDKAIKLIDYSGKLKGVDLSRIHYLRGLIYEYQHDYEKAILLYKEAKLEAYNDECVTQLDSEIKRAKMKKKLVDKSTKKKKKKDNKKVS